MTEYIVKESGYPGRLETEIVSELIRCKDCNKNYGSEHNPRCDYMDAHLWPDSFCSYAERKEGESS